MPCSAMRWAGLRCNLNLCYCLGRESAGKESRRYVPFGPNETLHFQKIRICVFVSFRTNCNNISILVVANDAWYFGIATDLLLTGKSGEWAKAGCFGRN